jgi:type I restriction enzyme S subunit
VPWVKTGEIQFSPIRKTEEAVSRIALDECSLPLLPPGTVLVAMYGQGKTRGQSAVLEIEATTNQACFAVLPSEAFAPEYLQYWLRFSYLKLRESSEGRGGNQSNLNGEILGNLEVPWVEREEQLRIAARLNAQLAEVDAARHAAQTQLQELVRLANAIIVASQRDGETSSCRLGDALDEVKQGIGDDWRKYPVLGATRDGLAPAKEAPGKQAPKYKPAFPGTVFYNPMRILIGSIAFVDVGDSPGITSPDYVAVRGRAGVIDSRWFYYWLRSPLGVRCINSLARGAVRERMLFNRLAEGEIELPSYATQQRASAALQELKPVCRSIELKLTEIDSLPQRLLSQAFEN